MLDFGWSEMAIIALLALLVIGPKDLPRVLRTMGQFMRKARSLSREFQSGLNDVMREAELDDARKAIEKTGGRNLDREIRKALDPEDEVEKELRDVDRAARDGTGKATTTPVRKGTTEPGGSEKQPATEQSKVVRHPGRGEGQDDTTETTSGSGEETATSSSDGKTQKTG